MHPLVSTSLVAAIVFWGSLAYWMLGGPKWRKSDAEIRSDRGTAVLIVFLTGLGLGAGYAVADRQVFGSPAARWALYVTGVAVIWLGIALALWSVRTLGRFYRPVVAIQEAHEVVTTGPYRYVRHPIYAGALLVMLGAGTALGGWLSILVCVLVPLPGYVRRIRVEERVLDASLGDAYQVYAADRPRLVPGIW